MSAPPPVAPPAKPRAPRSRRAKATTARASKKAKIDHQQLPDAPRRTRARAGMLAPLISKMPLEIMYEIMSNLLPLDLLNLSRTNKSFRSLLLKRSSISIWQAAQAQVPGLPDCPEDINEPQYANLLFGNDCYECGKGNVRKSEWALRVRLCEKCREKLLCRLPFNQHMIHTLLCKSTTVMKPTRYNYMLGQYYRPHIVQVYKQWEKLQGEERTQYESQKREYVTKVNQHANQCVIWADNMANQRASMREDDRERRRLAIQEKLTELGWGDELQHHIWDRHPSVRQPKELTDRIWLNIREPLVIWLTALRQERLKVDRLNILLHKYLPYLRQQLPTTAVFPSLAQLAAMDNIKPLLDNDSLVADPDTFNEIVEQLPEIVRSWRETIDARLVSLLPPPTNPSSNNNNQSTADPEDAHAHAQPTRLLSLATSVFTCTESQRDGLFYPDLLHHYFFNRKDTSYMILSFYPDGHGVYTPERRVGWSAPPPWVFKFDAARSGTVRLLLKAAGLSEEGTTQAEMDARDDRFACMECSKSKRAYAMGWRRAVEHARKCKPRGLIAAVRDHNWRLLTPAEAQRVRNIEAGNEPTGHVLFSAGGHRNNNSHNEGDEWWDGDVDDFFSWADLDMDDLETFQELKFESDEPYNMWSCNHCRELCYDRCLFEIAEMFAHLRTRHHVENPTEGVDYMNDPNGRVVGPRPIKFLLSDPSPTGTSAKLNSCIIIHK